MPSRSVRNDARTCFVFQFYYFCSQIDDDNLSKLEKADILELTVNHLTKLHSPKDPVLEAKKFQAGFGQCAAEACRFIMSVPDLDANVSQNLIGHLSRLITTEPLSIQVPERASFSPPTSPSSIVSDRHHYYSDHDRSSSDAEDSMYSGDGSKWVPIRKSPVQGAAPPTAGLLTTVDKLGHHAAAEQINGHVNGQRNTYFNRVPAEAKDIILQKIRQHIMDKRGNDNYVDNANVEPEPKYLYRDDAHRGEHAYRYASIPSNDTLDLRKVRSPTKPPVEAKNPVAYPVANQLEPTPTVESKVEARPAVPEHCESPMDYSNLPPKKKRKLIEYQEFKKQEAARLEMEAFYADKKERHRDGPPADDDGNKWRPW